MLHCIVVVDYAFDSCVIKLICLEKKEKKLFVYYMHLVTCTVFLLQTVEL